MPRRRKGRPIHGWVPIDKSAGVTSARVVAEVKRVTGAAKAGHGGTLDPLATGVLPVALGEATKTVPYLQDSQKAYEFTVRWGEARTTDDAEGETVATSDRRPDRAAIEAALSAFVGEIRQRPPAYSAIKVYGQRAYALAREGAPVELEERIVRIDRFVLVDQPDADHATFLVECGKGTYVRSLARDLARVLGTHGYVSRIRRIRVGPFDAARAISLDKLEELVHSAPLREAVFPVETVLDDIPALALTGPQASRLGSGQAVRVPNAADGVYRVRSGDRLVALAEAKDGEVRVLRVFHLQ